MMNLNAITDWLDGEYPASTAEEWDNVGLLIGDRRSTLRRVMTCLTVTGAVCDEARREKVDLIVSHHPFPFRPVRRITSDSVEGKLLLDLIGGGVAVYSPHTAHDSAPDGVNRQLATLFELVDVEPLCDNGSGRVGKVSGERTLAEMLRLVEARLGQCSYVGEPDKPIRRVAIACGAADEFVDTAVGHKADLLFLGEARFHTCLDAEARGLALILTGHYVSERFAVETLAEKIAARFSEISCFASRAERDVLRRFEPQSTESE